MIALALLGCATTSGLGTARTLPAGETQVVAGGELGWVGSTPFSSPIGKVDLGVRHGVTDRVEVGGQVGGWPLLVGWVHTGAYVKMRLHRAPSDDRGFDLALAGMASFDYVTGGGGVDGIGLTGQLPLLVSLNTKQGDEWVLGTRIAVQHLRSAGAAPITKPMLGYTLGYAWHVRGGTVYPTLGMLAAPNPADAHGGKMRTLQLGLELAF